jgi:hypothetical protein
MDDRDPVPLGIYIGDGLAARTDRLGSAWGTRMCILDDTFAELAGLNALPVPTLVKQTTEVLSAYRSGGERPNHAVTPKP